MLFLLLPSGCVLAPRSPLSDGRLFPYELASRVAAGMSESDVAALLGPPLVELDVDETKRWYYYSFVAEAGTDVYVCCYLRVQRAPSRTEEVEVTFAHGEVASARARTWRRRHEPKYRLAEPTGSNAGAL